MENFRHMERDRTIQSEPIPPQTMVTSFEIDVALHSQIKIYAAKNRLKIKDVVNRALKEYFDKRINDEL